MQEKFDENEKEERSTNGNQESGINNKPTVGEAEAKEYLE
jgi:hypothetical protein